MIRFLMQPAEDQIADRLGRGKYHTARDIEASARKMARLFLPREIGQLNISTSSFDAPNDHSAYVFRQDPTGPIVIELLDDEGELFKTIELQDTAQ